MILIILKNLMDTSAEELCPKLAFLAAMIAPALLIWARRYVVVFKVDSPWTADRCDIGIGSGDRVKRNC